MSPIDQEHFERLAALQISGDYEAVIRESQILIDETTNAFEQASLLIHAIASCEFLGRIGDAKRMFDQLQRLDPSDIKDIECRLNAELCEPCLLIQERRVEEGVAAFQAILQRHGDALKEPRFRYLYEDIQMRRALALAGMGRLTEALPILKEVVSFSFSNPANEQLIHYWLGVSLEEAKDPEAARKEFVLVLGFGLKNDLEEHARYRLGLICYMDGGFAQARQQLETIVQDHPNGDFVVSSHRRTSMKGLRTSIASSATRLTRSATQTLSEIRKLIVAKNRRRRVF